MDYIKREDALQALGEEPMVWDDNDLDSVNERNTWQFYVNAIQAIIPEPFLIDPVTVDDFIKAKGQVFILTRGAEKSKAVVIVVESEGIASDGTIRARGFVGGTLKKKKKRTRKRITPRKLRRNEVKKNRGSLTKNERNKNHEPLKTRRKANLPF